MPACPTKAAPFVRTLIALGLAALLAACSASAAGRDPSTLVILEPSDADTLNPLFSNNEAAFQAEAFIFEGLTTYGDDFTTIPWLAESWTHSPDNLHWRFRLRPGILWSDGVPMTARDVAFTWKIQLDPKTAFPYAGQFDYIKSVRAVNDTTVDFELRNTNALFLSQGAATNILPEHILGKLKPEEQRSSSFGEHPIGTGPYVLKRWGHDEDLLLEANPHWWHGPVSVKRVDTRIVFDANARLDALETGGGDFAQLGVGTAIALQRDNGTNIATLKRPSLFTTFIYGNFADPIFAQLAVRQAMLYGWDRQAAVDGLYRGNAAVANGIVPIGLTRWRTPGVLQYPYDPARARALLDAAGWHPGPDGIRVQQGRALELTLLFPGGGAGTGNLPADFQADMAAIGISINVRSLDYPTFIGAINDRKFQLAYSGWGGVSDPDQFTLLQSKQLPPNGNNIMGYSNPAVDRDVTRGLQEVDDAKRKPYYDDMSRTIAKDPPVIFESFGYYLAAYNRRIHFDVEKALPEYYVFRDVWRWKLDPP